MLKTRVLVFALIFLWMLIAWGRATKTDVGTPAWFVALIIGASVLVIAGWHIRRAVEEEKRARKTQKTGEK